MKDYLPNSTLCFKCDFSQYFGLCSSWY